ncbi:MAG TPA: radical SAM protein [Oceanobacillus sp.]|nr:radical SAM protein [Oceanobacillus sp.]
MGAKHLLNLFGDHIRTLPILVLYLTDGCNSRCVTCDIWRSPRVNMRRELIETLIAEIRPLGVKWVALSGGEAMQHPHWHEIARRLREQGAKVLLLTNGLLLRKQADLVIANVDEVVLSLDGGTAATYEAIRGVDAFDLLLEGLRAVRAGGIPVTTRTTVQQANFREIPLIIEAAKSADVNHISFLTVDVSNPFAFGPRFANDDSLPLVASMGSPAPAEHGPPASALTADGVRELAKMLDDVEVRFADDFASGRIAESPAKLRRMVNYFGAILGEDEFPYVRCNAPHMSAVIEVDGTLRPCYFLPSTGKVNHGVFPLRSTLNSPEALELRRAYRMGERAECQRCVCPLYKGPRALLSM